MRNWRFISIVIAIVIILDFYVFQAIKTVSQEATARTRTIIFFSYWGISVTALILFALLPFINADQWPRLRNYLFATLLGLFIAKLFAAVFLLVDDIRRLIQWIIAALFSRNTKGPDAGDGGISRSVFLSWLGLGVGGTLFSSLLYGFSNKYNYKVRRMRLAFDNLPPAFKGIKIVQLSDIHSGSFTDKAAVARGVDMVLKENADLILFTGDLVNDLAIEMNDYIDVFSRLQAPMGVFSTLGNHDYGDYHWWETPEAKRANLEHLKRIQAAMGWRLLMNEHVALEKGGQQIALIGIENWSAKARFPKYGKMAQAYAGAENYPFKILMSHDPSHWDAEVRSKYPDIDLALAGHTHGMQFGVEIPGIKWSPVQYVYKEWAGLYEEGRQKLYVNRGYGFIGYPGRVGILPEITVIELV
ncbi:MAG: metallophosphoesterase [Bacteroidota bacterium]|nr:metallophosphoesterase [Bacteroidota bacterium]MDP4216730.1 metallophosphoesterase [Bacteroidota bacterium]MDP4247487.1 metallophosphoesterase [Bacteroidota bacterium]MDP4254450.1 metallophosphoesterase [Bacteroidota bacterium]MDP4259264.1 metallophosphoesterase [Bacteroidota bacterium]